MKKLSLAILLALGTSTFAYAGDVAPLKSALKTDKIYEDFADAAVWVSKDKSKQLLITTQEGDGISVFDNSGKELFNDKTHKKVEGADIRYGVGEDGSDILAVGLPKEDAIGFYKITGEADKPLQFLNTVKVDMSPEMVCLGKNITTGDLFVNVGEGENEINQYKLTFDSTDNKVKSAITDDKGNAQTVRQINVGGPVSGCEVDDQTRSLYVTEKTVGIWKYGSEPENIKDRQLIDTLKPLGNLKAKAESVSIIYRPNGEGYLVVPEKKKGLFIYDRKTGEFIDSVKIDGINKYKRLALAPNALWVMNNKGEDSVYEKIDATQLTDYLAKQEKKIQLDDAISIAELASKSINVVSATAETKEVDDKGDAADDPAFWINSKDASKSLVIATNKKGGLLAYDLAGNEIQYFNEGLPNNVDIRQNVKLGDATYDLAAATNRENNTITLYQIKGEDKAPISKLTLVGENTLNGELVSKTDEVYGLCMHKAKDGTPYIFSNSKNGVIEQWKITATDQGLTGEKIARDLKVESQPEGCVVDDETGTLYVGEEDVAIWSFPTDEQAVGTAELFAKVDGKNLVDDIEGITIYNKGDKKYLIASSQGNNTYAIYNLADKSYVGGFAIKGDDKVGIDGTSDTDGIDVTPVNLGEKYPQGMFIAQDFYNIDSKYKQEHQNFKFVSWADVVKQLNL